MVTIETVVANDGIYRGPVDRVGLVYSNDPRRPRVQIRLTGTQVP